ncbi:GAF domain-containing protein [Pseudanabaena galeata UHCC 0370]|uniref:histidine kinase n=1 Tax=Pseudanabaena galeata UHCC 0370 TaxID=3110310 RepID=A0ABU5TPZ7_9CYAN|nr:GAF domain-containing protein [Pseudanabaena galeata]MEA5480111.1 GAF domain-containing protein [Pseudanabaena galeata UHCC 0370]
MFTSVDPLAHLPLTSTIILDPLVVEPETTVMEAIAKMHREKAHYLLVVKSEHLLGIFTEQDVLRLIAQRHLPHNLDNSLIGEVMSSPVVTLQEAAFTDALVAINLFQKYQIRQLPIVDRGDRLVGVVTSESMQSYASHQQTEMDYRKLMQELTSFKIGLDQAALVAITDVKGVITYVNDQFCEVSGYSRDELMGKTHRLIKSSYHPSAFFQDLWQTISHGQVWRGEICNRTKNGSLYWVDSTIVPFTDSQGRAQHYLAVRVDITARKLAEAALKSSETRFRRVFESNIVGMMFTDFSGQITDANDRFLDLLGYSRQDLSDKRISWETITPAEYLPSDLHALQHLKLSRVIAPWEKVYYHKDGHLIHVLIGVAMLAEDDCVCVVVDISDRKQAEEMIRQQVSRETLLREITQRIRQSLDIHTVFNTACQEIRSVIQADRVGIFKFYPDSGFSDGEFVAESVGEGFVSAMAIPIHDHCFGEKYAPLYLQGRYAAMSDIYQLQEQCHTDVLARFQVRANLVMPLFYGEQLWGLLCIHQCSSSRCWHPSEINFIQQISVQLGISLQQTSLYEQVQIELRIRKQAELELQQKAEQSKLLQTITQRIRSTLNLDAILKTTVEEVHRVLNSDRVLVYRVFPDKTGAVIAESVSPQWMSTLESSFPEEVFPQVNYDRYVQGRIFALRDREAEPLEVLPCLADFLADLEVRAKLVVPIIQNEALWGLLIAHQCDRPRLWQAWESNLLQQIAGQLAIAIQQADLLEQLQQELRDRQQTQQVLTEINQRLAVSNEELARATRLKDEFLANMSHELRTPLNAILGMTEGMQEQVFGKISNAQIKALQTIERSGSHLLELINDILDVAKIESGQIELEYSTISVESLCQSSLTFIRQQAVKKSIQLETKLSPNLPELIVDERRIRQVLINLLNNAVKFTSEGGCITLEASCQPLSVEMQKAWGSGNLPESDFTRYIHIAIRDTGIGIAPENISKLFQPFIQIDSALNRQYQGTGLGLALVKRIVEMHGGKVMLSSVLGSGSCFTVILPCAELASPSVAVAMEYQAEDLSCESVQTQQAAPVILLVEDNEANIITISSYLTAKGYLIVLANNGEEAIALAQSANPDLILMDIQMPVMDGLEATKQIRQIPSLDHVPIIAITALAMDNDVERCLAAGANDYLSKPIKLRQLTKIIQQFLTPDPYSSVRSNQESFCKY